MKNSPREAAAKYAAAAKNQLKKAGIDITGYGYIDRPISGLVETAISSRFFTAFTIERKGKRNLDFIISKDNKDREIVIEARDMSRAIKNIGSTAGGLRRKVKFVPNLSAKQLADREEKVLAEAIRKAML